MTAPLLDQAKAIVGMPGAGKSYTARQDVEQLLDDHRHLTIIDPTGVWYGLRSNARGTGRGFDIPIFGGEHGDVPIRPIDGAAIAGIVADQRVSAIIDLSLIHDSADQRDFVDAFVARLRHKPRGNFHLILDEAHEFAPEQLPDKEAHRLRENITWLQKSGRTRGFVLTLITQRPADIAKRVLNLAQTIVVHQLVAAGDQKAISDYLKSYAAADFRETVMGSLATLQVGERWVYSPGAGILDRGVTKPIRTFDSMKTPAPGETKLEPRTLAQLDVSAIRAALSGTIEREKTAKVIDDAGSALADVLRDRDQRITELERSLATAEQNASVWAKRLARVYKLARWGDPEFDGIDRDAPDTFGAGRAAPLKGGGDAAGGDKPPLPAATPKRSARRGNGAASGQAAPPSAPVDVAGAAIRGKKALAPIAAVYPAGLTEKQWALMAGLKQSGGTWGTYKGALKAAQLVELKDSLWRATAAGVEAAGQSPVAVPTPGPDLARFWGERIPGVRRMVDALVEVWPAFTTREDLADAIGNAVSGGTFGTYLGRLRSNGLLEESGKDVRLSADVMTR